MFPSLTPLLLLLTLLPPALSTTTTTTTTTPSAPPPLHTATLYHLPVAPPTTTTTTTPLPLALLTYTPSAPHLSTLHSFTPPTLNNISDLTSILVYLDDDEAAIRGKKEEEEKGKTTTTARKIYRSSVTATQGFHEPCRGRFRLALDVRGKVVGASWAAWVVPRDDDEEEGGVSPAQRRGMKKEGEMKGKKGDFDILTAKTAPRVVFDKAGKGKGGAASPGGGNEGEEEEVAEKTFLQKYWWVLLGVAVLAMTGGSDK